MHRFKLAAAAALLPLATGALSSSIATAAPGARGAEQVRVIVAYKDGQRGNAERALAMAGAEVHLGPRRAARLCGEPAAVAVEGLSRNPAIEYVEEDVQRYPLSLATQQVVPYGYTMVQANQVSDTSPQTIRSVCIIDSGIDIGHPDHGAKARQDQGLLRAGDGSWTAASPATWYTDENHHGTHVAGTIAALNNSLGVVGVAPSRHAEPLHRQGLRRGRLGLFVVAGRCAQSLRHGSRHDGRNKGFPGGKKLVVSMSLGGSLKSRTEETAFNNAYTKEQRAADRGRRQRRQQRVSATRLVTRASCRWRRSIAEQSRPPSRSTTRRRDRRAGRRGAVDRAATGSRVDSHGHGGNDLRGAKAWTARRSRPCSSERHGELRPRRRTFARTPAARSA